MKKKSISIFVLAIITLVTPAFASDFDGADKPKTTLTADDAVKLGTTYNTVDIAIGKNNGEVKSTGVLGGDPDTFTLEVPDSVQDMTLYQGATGVAGAATYTGTRDIANADKINSTPGLQYSDIAASNEGPVGTEMFFRNLSIKGMASTTSKLTVYGGATGVSIAHSTAPTAPTEQ